MTNYTSHLSGDFEYLVLSSEDRKRAACQTISVKNKCQRSTNKSPHGCEFHDTTDTYTTSDSENEEEFVQSLSKTRWTSFIKSCIQYCLLHYGRHYRSFLKCPVVGHILTENGFTIQDIRLFLAVKRTTKSAYFNFMNSELFKKRERDVEFLAPGKQSIILFHTHYARFPDHPPYAELELFDSKNPFQR